MNFQKKNISSSPNPSSPTQPKKSHKKSPKSKKSSHFFVKFALLFGVILILWLGYLAYNFFTHFSFRELFTLFGSMQTDEENKTQILLLGTGDTLHDSPDLTDTIIVASLNHDTHTISLLSIPRDLWVNYGDSSSSRINRIYQDNKETLGHDEAIALLRQTISEIIDQDIHYYAKVDFKVFRQLVDAVNGVDIEIPYKYCDEMYPDEFLEGYDPFCIESGQHHIDGELALRLARSRHGKYYDEDGNEILWSSDFDRAARQQKILLGIKRQVLDQGILSSATELKSLYDVYSENVETDLGFAEIWALAGFAVDLEDSHIVSTVLVDNTALSQGSFLYSPPREQYGGAAILRPQEESFEKIQAYIDLFFSHPLFFVEKPRIEILNSTNTPGLAQSLADELIPYGFNIVHLGNTADDLVRERTNIIFPHDPTLFPGTQFIIRNYVPGVVSHRSENYSNPNLDLTIELGKDFTSN